jgi:catechol 2,3-dioxygenase-like lactoylglutathione lyase family enzyme
MTNVHQITPFLHVPDIEAALSFFCNTLSFEMKFRESNYAYIELAHCGLRLLEEPRRVLTPDGKARVSVYVDVSNVDELYAQIREGLDRLPSDRVKGIVNTSWNQREFQVRLPDGDWLTFGQPALES